MEDIAATYELLMCFRRSLAMLSLAILSHASRETIGHLPDGFSTESIPAETAEKLFVAVVEGTVTTIVSAPQPFLFIVYKGTFGALRTVYGVVLDRPASWRGHVAPPPRILKLLEEVTE